MDHGPSTEWGEDRSSGFKTRLGLWMFLAYCVVYAGFVIISSAWPSLMANNLGGLNLAIVYGIGLIGLALVLAFVYNSLASKAEERCAGSYNAEEDQEEM